MWLHHRPIQNLILDFLPPVLCAVVFAYFYSRVFRCVVKFLMWSHPCPTLVLSGMNFPFSIVTHKSGYDVSTFSLHSRKSLIPFFISSMSKLSLSKQLYSFHVFVGFLLFLLLLRNSCRPQWSDRIHGIISIFLYLLRSVLWPIIWSFLEKVPWGAEKKVYSFALGWNVL